jgi:hypothetical protein
MSDQSFACKVSIIRKDRRLNDQEYLTKSCLVQASITPNGPKKLRRAAGNDRNEVDAQSAAPGCDSGGFWRTSRPAASTRGKHPSATGRLFLIRQLAMFGVGTGYLLTAPVAVIRPRRDRRPISFDRPFGAQRQMGFDAARNQQTAIRQFG